MRGADLTRDTPPTMQDWLDLHGLTAQGCADLVSHAPPIVEVATVAAPASWPEGARLWALAAAALSAHLPDLAEDIAHTAARTVVNFAPDPARHPRPFTVRLAEKRMVYASCPLSQGAGDPILVAHEFGHALQLHLVADRGVPPILRETCAFLAEEVLLRELPGLAGDYADAVAARLARARIRDFGRLRETLVEALRDPAARYKYDWNYPPARRLALGLCRHPDTDAAMALFHGRITLGKLREILRL
ncbi:MAG: hypothetical protein EP318_02335 [Rhodobacteraceae bacterium]|nr:MAG: hypothetical protein EP318_02335 [Paracoccaceae bacterium]